MLLAVIQHVRGGITFVVKMDTGQLIIEELNKNRKASAVRDRLVALVN